MRISSLFILTYVNSEFHKQIETKILSLCCCRELMKNDVMCVGKSKRNFIFKGIRQKEGRKRNYLLTQIFSYVFSLYERKRIERYILIVNVFFASAVDYYTTP